MKRDIWVFLFFLGLLLFNWPLITILRNDLPIYLFFVWGIFIIFIFIASRYTDRRNGGS